MATLRQLIRKAGGRKFLAMKRVTRKKYWVLGIGPDPQRAVIFAETLPMPESDTAHNLEQVDADADIWDEFAILF